MNNTEFKDITLKDAKSIGVSQTHNGTYISPINRIRIFSSDDWEEFTEEALYVMKEQVGALCIKRYAGSGDKGIDVALFYDEDRLDGVWDCYQCKHYDKPLSFSKQCVEIGKIIYYSYIGDYLPPKSYFFVAPLGCGTDLSFLLSSRGNNKLKQRVINEWDKYCQKQITNTKEILLDDKLKGYINNFNFSIFKHKTPSEMVEIHSKSKYHRAKFGIALPLRPENETPPKEIGAKEVKYINKLLDAYREHLNNNVLSISDIPNNDKINKHLSKSREEFFSAESLNNFSRDHLPDDTFENLKTEVYNYVENTLYDDHKDGFARVKKVTDKAHDTPVDSNSLKDCIKVRDKAGICHQLANEDKIDWVINE